MDIGGILGTIGVILILALIIGGAIFTLVKNKKKGKSPCGCHCAGCAMSGACHGSDVGTCK